MRTKMYSRIIGIFLKKHPFINALIMIQMIAVFAIGIIMTSAIDDKASYYKALEPVLSGDGLYCGGYFVQDDESGVLYKSTDEIKSKLKNVDFISTVNFASLQTGVDEETGEVELASALIYDDFSARLFTPQMEEGVWITDAPQTDELPQAVITCNNFGYKVGDVASFDGNNGLVKVKIVGIIGDNQKYLAANTELSSKDKSYQNMYSKHFNTLNDQLKNEGYSDEAIARELAAKGYLPDSTVYNQPVLFFTDKQWDKTGEEGVMSDSLFIKYNENISDNEKLFNRKYVSENLSVLTFANETSMLSENSKDIVYSELYTLLPIMVAIYLLVLIGAVSVNAINCKNNMRNYAVLYLNGGVKKDLMLISILYNGLISIVPLIITTAGALIVNAVGVLSNTVIAFGWTQIVVCVIVSVMYVAVSCVISSIMLTSKSMSRMLTMWEE